MFRLTLLTALACLALPTLAASATGAYVLVPAMPPGTPITEITYEGNDRTQPRILDRVLEVRVGEPLDPDAVERSRQAILDLNLFKSVTVRTEDDGTGGARLVFVLDEKRYWIAFPRIGTNSQGDVALGVHSRFNNLFGLDHTLVANYDQRDFSDDDLGTSDELRLRYRIPGIGDSRFDLRFSADLIALDRVERDAPGVQTATYDEGTESFSVFISRWLGERSIGHGWRLGGGLHLRNRTNEQLTGALVRDPEIQQTGLSFEATFTDLHHHVFSDTGTRFGARIEQGIPGVSDDSYWIGELYGSHIWNLGEPHHDLYLDAGLGFSGSIDPTFVAFEFGRPALRGALEGVRDGDSYEYLRLGYLRPVFGKLTLRGEVFLDLGRQRVSGFPSPDIAHIGIGAGIRWRIRSFVRLEIAMGIVYSPDTGEFQVWGGTQGLE